MHDVFASDGRVNVSEEVAVTHDIANGHISSYPHVKPFAGSVLYLLQ